VTDGGSLRLVDGAARAIAQNRQSQVAAARLDRVDDLVRQREGQSPIVLALAAVASWTSLFVWHWLRAGNPVRVTPLLRFFRRGATASTAIANDSHRIVAISRAAKSGAKSAETGAQGI
jgi:hypothetical protein